jgi:hypothetical protein
MRPQHCRTQGCTFVAMQYSYYCVACQLLKRERTDGEQRPAATMRVVGGLETLQSYTLHPIVGRSCG